VTRGESSTQALERFKTANQDWWAGYLRTDLLPPHEISAPPVVDAMPDA
jgi:hypothetical protein